MIAPHNEKGARRRRKHGTLAESKKFCPTADPLPGGAGRPKFNQLEMVNTFTYKLTVVRTNACSFEVWYGILEFNVPLNTV